MTPLDTFVSLSVILTGYDQETIQPSLDTQHLAQLYFDTLNKNAPAATVTALFSAFTNITTGTPQVDIVSQVKTKIIADPVLGPVAKNIIRMWYLGVWYTDDQQQNGFVVSATAYKNGLVWGAMGAHPMGYSQENFGYWGIPPVMPPLA